MLVWHHQCHIQYLKAKILEVQEQLLQSGIRKLANSSSKICEPEGMILKKFMPSDEAATLHIQYTPQALADGLHSNLMLRDPVNGWKNIFQLTSTQAFSLEDDDSK